MNPGSHGLTARGRIVLASAVLMAVAAYLFGIQELYCLSLAATVLLLSVRLWVQMRGWDVAVTRQVHPARMQAGMDARVELTVRNRSGRPTPPLEARDAFDSGHRWAQFSIAALAPGELRSSSYALPSHRRGIYHLGPLELQVVDPFGLAQRRRNTAADTSLTVHPRYELLPVHAVSSHRDDDRRPPRSTIGRHGSEFYMLREYVSGDDLRRVHWPSTARLDDLVIRQPEGVRRGRVTIVADVRAPAHTDDSLEAALSAVASLAVSCLHAGLQVRVVTTGGFDSGHRSGRPAATPVLDGLAAASLHRPVPGVPPFRMAGRLDPVILVTTDRASETDLQSAFGLGGPNGTTVVVFETASGTLRPATPPRARRSVRVPAGASFGTAWSRWEEAMC